MLPNKTGNIKYILLKMRMILLFQGKFQTGLEFCSNS